MRNSWAFWFGRSDSDPRVALDGRLYHSFSKTDSALVGAMRLNDYVFRGTFDYPGIILPIPGIGTRRWHYNRNAVESMPGYRAPVGRKRLYQRVPALLQPRARKLLYGEDSLNVPIGAAPVNPLANTEDTKDAITLGWRVREHSDHINVAYNERFGWGWFPRVWPWYAHILGGERIEGLPRIDAAIPLGEE